MGVRAFLHGKFWIPILGQLKQGAAPERLAWSAAAGLIVALFPIFGVTTGLGVIVGVVFRLNHIVLQAVNYLAIPLQLAAIPILIRAGESAFGLPPVSFHPARLRDEFIAAPQAFLSTYGASGLAGIAVWAIFAPFVLVGIRLLFLPFLKRKLQEPVPHDPA